MTRAFSISAWARAASIPSPFLFHHLRSLPEVIEVAGRKSAYTAVCPSTHASPGWEASPGWDLRCEDYAGGTRLKESNSSSGRGRLRKIAKPRVARHPHFFDSGLLRSTRGRAAWPYRSVPLFTRTHSAPTIIPVTQTRLAVYMLSRESNTNLPDTVVDRGVRVRGYQPAVGF